MQRCQLHHHGRMSSKYQRCQIIGQMEKDCRVRLQGAGNDFLRNVTCFGCGENISRTSVRKQGTNKMMELVGELTWCDWKITADPNVVTDSKVQGETAEKDLRSLCMYQGDEKRACDIRCCRDFHEDWLGLLRRFIEEFLQDRQAPSPVVSKEKSYGVGAIRQDEALQILKERKLCNACVSTPRWTPRLCGSIMTLQNKLLERKERIKPRRVTCYEYYYSCLDLKNKILEAQSELLRISKPLTDMAQEE
ncbi:hypothetical protein Tco_0568044 [Tanacetum coccineum]